MGEFDFSYVLGIKISMIKRMLFWTGALKELSPYFFTDHSLAFETSAKEKIENYANDWKEKERESPGKSPNRIFIFRDYHYDAGYDNNEVDN